jgi:hypothetical protein
MVHSLSASASHASSAPKGRIRCQGCRARTIHDALARPNSLSANTHAYSGRVEDERGNLGLLANVPFPTSAHRTGLADLPHPALRLASQ